MVMGGVSLPSVLTVQEAEMLQDQDANSVNCGSLNLAWGQPVSHDVCIGLPSVCMYRELSLLTLPSLWS